MLAWASLLIRRQIARARVLGLLPPPISSTDVFAGAYISDADVENAGRSLLLDAVAAQVPQTDEVNRLDAQISELHGAIARRLAATSESGRMIPFVVLCQQFGLLPQEGDLLMVVAAAAMDARIRRLLAYLQNDFSKRRPDAGTTLATLHPHASGANLPWQLLDPDGRLRAFNLIQLHAGERERGSWLMERSLSIPDALVAFLARGTLWLDESIAGYTRLLTPQQGFSELCLLPSRCSVLQQYFKMAAIRVEHTGEAAGLLLRGLQGSGRKAAALAMCKERGQKLMVVDATYLPAEEEAATQTMRTVIRDARLHRAAIYIENVDALKRETPPGLARLHAISLAYRLNGGLMLFGSESEERLSIEDELDLQSVTIPALDDEQRTLLWQRALPEDAALAQALASQFPTLPGIIVSVGKDIQALQKLDPASIDKKTLTRQVLDRSRHNLRAIATEVKGSHSWADVILPADILERCQRIEQLVRGQNTLAASWGLGKKILTNRGVSALFSGPPGAGKTMVAGIIGRQLGFDVFRIDISRVFSKWVGETEKNLAKVFDEANRTRAVLIFDEADALFSKRTEVKSASDRYSNVEVNYLLQKMESFEGVIILTTNLEKGVDEAFVRRLNFKIRFSEPTPEERLRMWQLMIPKEIELSSDVDLWDLAQTFDVTGGFIRNAVLRASVISYARGASRSLLTQQDLTQAITEELQESGRLA